MFSSNSENESGNHAEVIEQNPGSTVWEKKIGPKGAAAFSAVIVKDLSILVRHAHQDSVDYGFHQRGSKTSRYSWLKGNGGHWFQHSGLRRDIIVTGSGNEAGTPRRYLDNQQGRSMPLRK